MIDINAVREEMNKLHAEATAHVETYASAEPTADEQAAQDARFARLEKLAKSVEDFHKLAKFAYTGERPEGMAADVKRPSIKVSAPSAEQRAVEAYNAAPVVDSKDVYGRVVGGWIATGSELDESYATIVSTSANGLIFPRFVGNPLTPTRSNVYRVALAYYGEVAESLGSTGDMSVPIITADSGGKVTEGGTVSGDGSPSVSALVLKIDDYHSGTFKWSRKMFLSPGYDYTVKTRPALASAKDHGFAKDITAGIKADSAVTQSVTTPSTSTIGLDTLDDAIAKVSVLYDDRLVIILGAQAFNALNKLKDTTGVPILSRNDVQGQSVTAYKGVPVLKDDTLDNMGTSTNLVGLVIGIDGFKIRDESEELVRFAPTETAPTSIGVDLLGQHGYAYVPEAIVKILN